MNNYSTGSSTEKTLTTAGSDDTCQRFERVRHLHLRRRRDALFFPQCGSFGRTFGTDLPHENDRNITQASCPATVSTPSESTSRHGLQARKQPSAAGCVLLHIQTELRVSVLTYTECSSTLAYFVLRYL